jgi:glycosyltransferase involved in cell wall biosynthesis
VGEPLVGPARVGVRARDSLSALLVVWLHRASSPSPSLPPYGRTVGPGRGAASCVLEAAGQGVATVTTDLGGTPEFVIHGDTGVLVPAGDADALAQALNDLAADAATAVLLGQRAWRRVVEERSPEQHVATLVHHYDTVSGLTLRG